MMEDRIPAPDHEKSRQLTLPAFQYAMVTKYTSLTPNAKSI